jgi:hypothetical protein
MGLTTAMLSIVLLIWQQVQSRRAVRQATHAVSDGDWYKRLARVRKRWSPARLEREKFSISRR